MESILVFCNHMGQMNNNYPGTLGFAEQVLTCQSVVIYFIVFYKSQHLLSFSSLLRQSQKISVIFYIEVSINAFSDVRMPIVKFILLNTCLYSNLSCLSRRVTISHPMESSVSTPGVPRPSSTVSCTNSVTTDSERFRYALSFFYKFVSV